MHGLMEPGWLLDQQSVLDDWKLETFQLLVNFGMHYIKEQQSGKGVLPSCHSCFWLISGLWSMCAQDVINDHCKSSVDEQVVLSEEDILNGGEERIRLYANYFSLPCPKVSSVEFILHKDHWCQDMANLEHFNPFFKVCSVCMSKMAAVAWDLGSPACSCSLQLKRSAPACLI